MASASRKNGHLDVDDLIRYANERKASDLFLRVDSRPAIKRHGLVEWTDLPVLDEAAVQALATQHATPDQVTRFERDRELNISYSVPGVVRIRQNLYWQRSTIATAIRLIPLNVLTLPELGIESQAILQFTSEANGLILVTGPTGSGKSTTLAAMIEHINRSRPANIITVEDPIEYVYTDQNAIISQREVGTDTHSFHEALKQILRQAPDVILIGELRDIDTLNVAMQAAETGHLVFATLHTASAAETLDRISNMYAPHERAMLWLRLSVSLRGVVSQKLLRKTDGSGRLAAMEIAVSTPTVSKMLEDGRSDDIYNAMRHDGEEGYWGMQTMNQALRRFVQQGVITEDHAIDNAGNRAELRQMLRRSNQEREAEERELAEKERSGIRGVRVRQSLDELEGEDEEEFGLLNGPVSTMIA